MSDLCKSPNRDIAKHCPGIELNCQSLDIEERFCYLGTQQMLEGVKMIVLYQGSGVDGLKKRLQEEDYRQERNEAGMFGWMCNVSSEACCAPISLCAGFSKCVVCAFHNALQFFYYMACMFDSIISIFFIMQHTRFH